MNLHLCEAQLWDTKKRSQIYDDIWICFYCGFVCWKREHFMEAYNWVILVSNFKMKSHFQHIIELCDISLRMWESCSCVKKKQKQKKTQLQDKTSSEWR